MGQAAGVDLIVQGMITAARQGEWDTIRRLDDRIRMIILDATADHDQDALTEVANALEMAEAIFPTEDEKPRLDHVASTLGMNASLAKLAARRIFNKSNVPVEISCPGRDEILCALENANASLPIDMIAERSGVTCDSVSILLPFMENEGLVRCRRLGRRTFTRITASGREAMKRKVINAHYGIDSDKPVARTARTHGIEDWSE